jgi:hypothetical protein
MILAQQSQGSAKVLQGKTHAKFWNLKHCSFKLKHHLSLISILRREVKGQWYHANLSAPTNLVQSQGRTDTMRLPFQESRSGGKQGSRPTITDIKVESTIPRDYEKKEGNEHSLRQGCYMIDVTI